VESFKTDTVIFLPDEYLASNVAKETGKHIIFPVSDPMRPKSSNGSNMQYHVIGWHGKCEVHEQFTPEDVLNVRKQFPDVMILAHPECSPEVVALSDYSGSTTQLTKYVQETDAPQYLLLTECSMGDNIAAENPEKNMLGLCSVRCPHMNEITLEDTLSALQNNQYEVDVPEDIRIRAKKSVDRMLEIQ
jgi:quinolinate synthase